MALVTLVVGVIALGVLGGLAWRYKGATFAVLATAVAAAFFFAPGRGGGPEVVTVTDTIPSPALLARVAELELDTASLRSRLRARESRQPETRTQGSSPIPAPGACVIGSAIDREGRLSVAPVFRVADSALVVSRYLPELRTGIDVSDCDDGVSIGADGAVVCDRPRLGHLGISARAVLEYPLAGEPVTGYPGVGLTWTPTFRSAWSVGAYLEARPDVVFSLAIERRILGIF